MIISGRGPSCNRFFFAQHLTNGEQNEKVRVADIKGFVSETPHGCFREMELISKATRVKDYFYHADINPKVEGDLTPEQWEITIDRLEKGLGLEGQPRFVVEHTKKGRTHRHAVWLRIDMDKLTGIPHPWNYKTHQKVAKQLEKEFGLEPVHRPYIDGADKDNRPERAPKSWEKFRGQKSGIDPKEMQQEISELWNEHEKGQDFVDALEARGYLVARGDSRNYCVVDQVGDIHSLARRLPREVKAADVKERLKGIDPKSLPHVKEAVASQRSRAEETERDQTGRDDGQGGGMSAGDQEEQRRQGEIEKEELRQQQAVKDQEQQIKEAVDYEEKRDAVVQEQAELAKDHLKEIDKHHRHLIAFRKEQDRQAEQAKKDEARRKAREGQREESPIRSADVRYSIALSNHYDMSSPYSSLARASMAESGALLRDRAKLKQQIATEKDPDKKKVLELQRDIEYSEYMALTSRRIGRMSEITQGKDAAETVRQYERADQFKAEAQALRKEYREHVRGGGRSGSDDPPPQPPKQEQTKEARPQAAQKEPAKPLKVELRKPKVEPNSEENLVDYVRGLPEKPERRTFTKDELRHDPEAKKLDRDYTREDRRRAASLKTISRNLQAGRNLNKDDIKDLSREDLKGIAQNGDAHLKSIVKQHELERSKGRSRGR